jgi:ABC-type lipoprotein export system ATPase subunit
LSKQLLSVYNVTKTYGDPGDPAATRVLNGVNLQMQPGETVAVAGPSGCGKSTLLNIIGTLDHPTSGQVELSGRSVVGLRDEVLARIRALELGFIFQMHHLLPQCTAMENVLIPTLAARAETGEKPETRAERLLKRVGLEHRMHATPDRLSGGERQRVAVVRALINRPQLLLADEPTGALDTANADQLTELLLELNREEGTALLVITHSPELAARMGRTLRLQDGILVPQT